MRRWILIGLGVLILSWAVWYALPGGECYITCREVAGYYGERLELSRGTFRYWTYSDFVVPGQVQVMYPLTGTYDIEGERLILNHAAFKGEDRIRIMDRLNGVPVLWPVGFREHYLEKGKEGINYYALMIRADRALLPFLPPRRPSLKILSVH